MRICVRGSDGISFWARALVDTGAQVNLLGRGLRDHLMVPSKEPLQLVTADGRRVGGGDIGLSLTMFFKVQNGTGSETDGWRFQWRFHDADIEHDMILENPWLQEHKVAVLAGEDALGV